MIINDILSYYSMIYPNTITDISSIQDYSYKVNAVHSIIVESQDYFRVFLLKHN